MIQNTKDDEPCDFYDRIFYEQRLTKDAKRIFTSEGSSIEVLTRSNNAGKQPGTQVTTVADVASLQRLLENDNENTVFVLRQNHTWSPLNSSLELTIALLSQLDVFPPFLNLINNFGRRVNDIGDDFHEYHHSSRKISTTNGLCAVRETCFNVRYPERNGRSSGNPWSIRHTAVYHRHESLKDSNTWILVQPSSGYHAQIYDIFARSSSDSDLQHSLSPICFLSTGRYWRDYISHLQKQVSTLEHKALYSKAPTAAKSDFEVSFDSLQDLQHLRRRVLQVQLLVDSTATAVQRYAAIHNSSSFQVAALDDYLFQLRGHKRITTNVLAQLDGLYHVLLEIMKSRNDEVARNTSNAICQNGREISKLIHASSLQSDAISELAQKTQCDSHTLKIFSVVAFFYLPATLVASVFNSGLVDTVLVGGLPSREKTSFKLASQFWMFPVLTAALTFLSLCVTAPWLLRRRKD